MSGFDFLKDCSAFIVKGRVVQDALTQRQSITSHPNKREFLKVNDSEEGEVFVLANEH
jgi:hypothetical protein